MKQEDKGQYFIQSKSNLPLPINNYYIEGIRDKHPEGSFLRIFWDHQKEALTKHPKGMRWHPLMIRSGSILVTHRIIQITSAIHNTGGACI